jgi:hypothetical protein
MVVERPADETVAAETLGRMSATKEVLKDAQVVVIDGGDHLSTPPRSEFLRALLDFLKAHAAGEAK